MIRKIVNKAIALSIIAASVVGASVIVTAPAQITTENKPPTENQHKPTPLPVSIKCDYSQPVNNYVDKLSEEEIVDSQPVPSEEPVPLKYTTDELDILALIIYQEAGGDIYSDDTRLKVGSVFLNRVDSDRFPNTFEEVATQKLQYGILYWTGIEWPHRASLPEESEAVLRSYTLAEKLLNGGSVLPDNVVWQAEFPQGDGVYSYQDDMYFCYTEVK